MKNCPYCAEQIQDEAIFCRFCRRDLGSAGTVQTPPIVDTPAGSQRVPGSPKRLGYIVLAMVLCLLVSGMWVFVRKIQADADRRVEEIQMTATQHSREFAATGTQQAHALAATITAQARISYLTDPFNATLMMMYGPNDGALMDKGDKTVPKQCSEVNVRDFVAEARFQNPYAASSGKWDYGFLIRHIGKNQHFRVFVTSKGLWYLTNGSEDLPGQGTGDVSLQLEGNDTNLVRLVAYGDTGYLYVNGSLISQLNLGMRMDAGDVCVAVGIINGYNEGYDTFFEDFKVWSIENE